MVEAPGISSSTSEETLLLFVAVYQPAWSRSTTRVVSIVHKRQYPEMAPPVTATVAHLGHSRLELVQTSNSSNLLSCRGSQDKSPCMRGLE